MPKYEKILKLKFEIVTASGIGATYEEYTQFVDNEISPHKKEDEETINDITFQFLIKNNKAFSLDWKVDFQTFLENIIRISQSENHLKITSCQPNEEYSQCTAILSIVNNQSTQFEIPFDNPHNSLHEINTSIKQISPYVIKYFDMRGDGYGFFVLLQSKEHIAVTSRFIDYETNDY